MALCVSLRPGVLWQGWMPMSMYIENSWKYYSTQGSCKLLYSASSDNGCCFSKMRLLSQTWPGLDPQFSYHCTSICRALYCLLSLAFSFSNVNIIPFNFPLTSFWKYPLFQQKRHSSALHLCGWPVCGWPCCQHAFPSYVPVDSPQVFLSFF